ncbi:hypothetical protein [Maribellus maritimus]|uniref:hypothetical protein n=1 Tax=Maribellus maritimus TaxID=2870838 RepID=UPI001EEB5782|nr:hypothetical protein [Maribellus maritimus]MCG6186835.1 hypothetical protein [Maribellus maritimus]
MRNTIIYAITIVMLVSCRQKQEESQGPVQVSGIYPQLAYYNNEGECGTGAVVPWAGRLWVITYGPHLPHGSSDKLYEITPNLEQIVRQESIGGTPANRMIHKESSQLFIGPYAIDGQRNVKVIPYSEMQGRHTGNARHLFHPEEMIYYGTMEEGFYEVDVNSLKVTELYKDGNNSSGRKVEHDDTDVNPVNATLPGAHGKGLYSGQGVMVYSNNGEATQEAQQKFDVEAGSLSEWDGKNWKVVRRNQFVEITGPGGIYGNVNPETDPIWATGWDHKSLLLGVRNPKTGWDFYRLPKASHSYDGAHGWNTEWPRIRDIGTEVNPEYLMTMHGMFWDFPGDFSARHSAGIRPRSAYLKVIGDFTRWNGRLVFGCDDSAQKEFLNKRKQKGNIEGPGQSNSNLWFTTPEKPDQLGPATASGAVWLNDELNTGEYSEPFLFSGWEKRCAWIQNAGKNTVEFSFEIDKNGNGDFSPLKTVELVPGSSRFVEFSENEVGEWVRIRVNKATKATVSFNYTDIDVRKTSAAKLFDGIATIDDNEVFGGLLYGLADSRRALGVSALKIENGITSETGYYELDENLKLVSKDDLETNNFIREKFAIPENVVRIDNSSVLVVDDKGRRWRLPLGDKAYKSLTDEAELRICREVATERDLFNCSGTFYELPAENADGFAKIRPVSSHSFRINDYASYRGMLVLTGLDSDVKAGDHIVRSDDGKAAVWLGVIDDLWEMGKPVGHGGPWKNSDVKAGHPSDPYLIGFYDKRSLEISHDNKESVTFKIEVEPIGHGPWMLYKEINIQASETYSYEFPSDFQSRWIRFVANKECTATAWLEYK